MFACLLHETFSLAMVCVFMPGHSMWFRYKNAVHRERAAFTQLIHDKEGLLLDRDQDGKHVSAGLAEAVYALTPAMEANAGSRKGGGRLAPAAGPQPPTILVDAREFRSQLPNFLHARGLVVQPITLEIGDYVLSNTLAVERKSIADLIGSFQSGRLFAQMEAMCRFFTVPYLLIEFESNQPFALPSAARDLTYRSGASSFSSGGGGPPLISKLILLTLHFPKLRILWSRSPMATAQLFVQLKQGQPEPSADECHAVSTTEQGAAHHAELVLRKLPGVTDQNWRNLARACPTLRDLARATRAQLEAAMDHAHGQQLYTFLHRPAKELILPAEKE